MPEHPLSRRIAEVLELDPDAAAIEYDGQWSTWRQVGEMAHRIASAGEIEVGMLLRNRPAHVAALFGVLLGGGTVVTINPSRGDDRTRVDIEALHLPVIVGAPEDLASMVLPGPTAITISGLDAAPRLTAPSAGVGRPGVAVRMLTSGTTGPPKRVDLTYDMLARSVIGRIPATRRRTAARYRHRQRAAGAHRRRFPGSAVCLRGKAVRVVGPVRAGWMGRRGP